MIKALSTTAETLLQCLNKEIKEEEIHNQIEEQFDELTSFEANMLIF